MPAEMWVCGLPVGWMAVAVGTAGVVLACG